MTPPAAAGAPASSSSSQERLYAHPPAAASSKPLPAQPAAGSGGKRPGWYRRHRRLVWLLAALLAAVVVTLAVVLPVELTRHRARYSEQELYFPTGYNGTGLNGRLGSPRNSSSNGVYDELLVFGSSYSDNAHDRASQYSGSYAPADGGYYDRHWSNGLIWVEYLRAALAANASAAGVNTTLVDYAYGGATTNNSIHYAGVPDTSQQMQMYMQERPGNGSARALVAMFTTTNDITAEFSNYLSSASRNLTASLATIRASATSLIDQLASLAANSSRAPDYLVLPILPVELTPYARGIAASANASTDAVRALTAAYNAVLMQGAAALPARTGGSVWTYDTPAWFYAMFDSPSRYGLASATQGCYVVGCSKPSQYIWWDKLHLVTTMQKRLATTVAGVVLGG